MSKHQIDIIPSYKIDQQKWNACIGESKNSLIYAYAFYLDYMCNNWHAIILNDYEAIMPVPWRKKFGIRYCYDVPFIQQLGIFCSVNEEWNELFLESLFQFCKYGDYNFNFNNRIVTSSRNNFIIDLSQNYQSSYNNYKDDLINNLKKAAKQEFIYAKDCDYKNAITLYKETYGDRLKNVHASDYTNFEKVCAHLADTNDVIIRSAMSHSNQLLSIALLLKDEHRLYNIMNTPLEEGRRTEANHFLLNEIIKEFAGSDLIFDFEGSDIPGVKSFYEKFGAINQPYYSLHFNKLPAPIRWLKK